MHALVPVEEDLSLPRYGYLPTNNAAAVRKEVTEPCPEVRPHALASVSSSSIPDAFRGPRLKHILGQQSSSFYPFYILLRGAGVEGAAVMQFQ